LRQFLESIGFEAREATNGEEAVAEWASWHPHLIWMDMRMPVMDGLEATRRIREAERTSENGASGVCKILALTASAFEHDRERFLSAGCDDFLPKPFKTATLLGKMTEHLGVEYVYGEAAADPVGEREALTPDRLSKVPAEVLDALRRALLAGDVEAALVAVERVREREAALADGLAARVRSYQFDEILDCIETSGAA
jgi:CheY-like chemotaxis protein